MRVISNPIVFLVFLLLCGFFFGQSKKYRQHSLRSTLFSAGRIAGEVYASHRDEYSTNENPVLIIQHDANLKRKAVEPDENAFKSRSDLTGIKNVQKLGRQEKNLTPQSADSAVKIIFIGHSTDSKPDFKRINEPNKIATERPDHLRTRSILIVEPEITERESVFSRTGSNW